MRDVPAQLYDPTVADIPLWRPFLHLASPLQIREAAQCQGYRRGMDVGSMELGLSLRHGELLSFLCLHPLLSL